MNIISYIFLLVLAVIGYTLFFRQIARNKKSDAFYKKGVLDGMTGKKEKYDEHSDDPAESAYSWGYYLAHKKYHGDKNDN